MLSGFGAAPTKSEGSAINFDDANEADNPGSPIVTAAIRGNTLLVSAFFREDESSVILQLDLDELVTRNS